MGVGKKTVKRMAPVVAGGEVVWEDRPQGALTPRLSSYSTAAGPAGAAAEATAAAATEKQGPVLRASWFVEARARELVCRGKGINFNIGYFKQKMQKREHN